MPNKIDRYILSLFWGFFLGGLAVFITLFVAIDAMSTLVQYKGISLPTLAKYYGFYLPEVIYRMTPISALVGTVFTLATLSRSAELVALFSIGMSLFRVARSILISVIVLSGFSLFLSDRVLPNFTKQKNFVFYHEIRKNPSMFSIVKNQKIWYRTQDKIFYIKTLDEKAGKAQGLNLYYFDEAWNLLQMISAENVELGKEVWTLKDGSVTFFTQDSSFPQTSQFKTKKIPMDRDTNDLSSTGNTSEMLSIQELSQFIDRNKAAGLDTVRYEVDFHSKFGYCLSALVMVLMGIPFSVSRSRSGGFMYSVGICFGLIFLYWIFYSSSLTLGNYRYLPPILAAWIPNLICLALGLYFIRVKRA